MGWPYGWVGSGLECGFLSAIGLLTLFKQKQMGKILFRLHLRPNTSSFHMLLWGLCNRQCLWGTNLMPTIKRFFFYILHLVSFQSLPISPWATTVEHKWHFKSLPEPSTFPFVTAPIRQTLEKAHLKRIEQIRKPRSYFSFETLTLALSHRRGWSV